MDRALVDDVRQQRRFARRLLSWGRANRRDFPWRNETEPFRILVAEVLLQRSRGRTVALVYEELFSRWPSASDLGEADVAHIEGVIRPLGLIRRAASLKAMAEQVAEHGVPKTVDGMTELPGVGRYAASATAAAAFGRGRGTVDGTSARVYRRVFGLSGPRDAHVDEGLWELVEAVTPRSAVREWNWAVLDLAAAICLPKVPRCEECPVVRECTVGSARIQGSVAGPS